MQPIENDGTKRPIAPFDIKEMEQLLEDKSIKEVRVFKLKPGMKLNIQGIKYKVVAVRQNGKVTLKEI